MSGRGRGSFSRLLHDRGAGTQGQGNATQDRSQNDQFFHKLIDTTNTASSQVASPDVLKATRRPLVGSNSRPAIAGNRQAGDSPSVSLTPGFSGVSCAAELSRFNGFVPNRASESR